MSKGRAWLFAIFAVVVAFGAGYGWQYMRATELQQQLDTTLDRVAALELQGEAGQASLLAQQGDFEAARRRASTFFTELQALADENDANTSTYAPILAQRDEVITALSRANPEAAALLASIYARISGTEPPPVQRAEPMQPAAPAGSTAADTIM